MGSTAGAPGTTVALFHAGGTETPAPVERERLAADYEPPRNERRLFCRLLFAIELPQPITVQGAGTNPTEETTAPGNIIHGLLAVSDPALATLPDASFLQLIAEGHLGAVYTHLASLRSIERLPG